MPHVIVKLWPGKTEQQKIRLAEAITKDVMDSALRRAVCFGSDRRNPISRLGGAGLQAGHQKQIGPTLQEAGVQ